MLWLNPSFSKKVYVSPFEMLGASLEEALKINELLDIYNDLEEMEYKEMEEERNRSHNKR